MDDTARQLRTLLDLDARHDELLRQLEVLDERVEKVLAEWTGSREPVPGAACPIPSAVQDAPIEAQDEQQQREA